MATVTTVVESVYAKISWVAPSDNGAAITHYKILIESAAGAMVEESTYCPGTDPDTRDCLVPMSILRAASPYNLPKGTLIKVQVQAQNLKGWSTASTSNTAGAVVETEPVAPGAASRVATTDDTKVDV
jgi:hypothetical protein